MSDLKNYILVTLSYWGFTITDGALRMLVLLFFHDKGYSPLEVASLFLLYEFFGVVTNLIGGWIGSRLGLNITLQVGLFLQVCALVSLGISPDNLTVPFVMIAQAISGIAKDLSKMSAKSSIKLLVPKDDSSTLLKWVAILTGSKNALKGAGFFIGSGLLSWVGFQKSVYGMASVLAVILILTLILLRSDMGKSKAKAKFTQIFSKNQNINLLSAARFFLFGSRDIWFVIGLPIFLQKQLGWSHTQVGSFLALWIVGYGFVQTISPKILGTKNNKIPDGATAQLWAFLLAILPIGILLGFWLQLPTGIVLIAGLGIFGFIFAVNSALHSYLILEYADHDKVAMNVGFYYMANAGGRLVGTILSGYLFQKYGLIGCLIGSLIFVLCAGGISLKLPRLKLQQ
jgi:predicted MFS family arabinose efflux permease